MRGRDVTVIIGTIVLVILLISLLGGGMMMGWGMMGWGGYGFNPLGWILMLVFWVLIIGGVALLAVWLFRQARPLAVGPGAPEESLEILKERFARGEISREQYEEMRRTLEGR